MMRLGIYGGTFAPIHNAHVRAAEAFLQTYALDKLMVIPAGIPPHKRISAEDDPQQRLTMCRLAFEGEPKIEVSDMELKRKGKSYTVDTLRSLTAADRPLFLLCGTDMILTFDQWYCFEEIFRLCTVVFARREREDDHAAIESRLQIYREKFHARVEELALPAWEISSTEVRRRVCAGEDISALVPENVAKYIKEHRLYLHEN